MRFFIVRHAPYDDITDRISKHGAEVTEKLATAINRLVPEQEAIAMVSSNAPRAIDTALIFGDVLNIEFEARRIFWSDNFHPYDSQAAVRFLEAEFSKEPNIIVVTYLELAAEIPRNLRQHYEGRPDGQLGKGEAWFIDSERRTIERITVQ